MAIKTNTESGFALLISLIVVAVVLSIGLSILDLSIKQVQLSTNARESEQAFHAANAGLECARYWRRAASSSMEFGMDIDPNCFSTSDGTISPTTIPLGTLSDPDPRKIGDGDVFQYEYEFTWGGGDPRCTQINTLVASTSPLGTGVTTTNMTTLIPGYPDPDGTDTKYCEPGARCSTISVRGYNRPCSTVGGFGVVQREVLLEF